MNLLTALNFILQNDPLITNIDVKKYLKIAQKKALKKNKRGLFLITYTSIPNAFQCQSKFSLVWKYIDHPMIKDIVGVSGLQKAYDYPLNRGFHVLIMIMDEQSNSYKCRELLMYLPDPIGNSTALKQVQ